MAEDAVDQNVNQTTRRLASSSREHPEEYCRIQTPIPASRDCMSAIEVRHELHRQRVARKVVLLEVRRRPWTLDFLDLSVGCLADMINCVLNCGIF